MNQVVPVVDGSTRSVFTHIGDRVREWMVGGVGWPVFKEGLRKEEDVGRSIKDHGES